MDKLCAADGKLSELKDMLANWKGDDVGRQELQEDLGGQQKVVDRYLARVDSFKDKLQKRKEDLARCRQDIRDEAGFWALGGKAPAARSG